MKSLTHNPSRDVWRVVVTITIGLCLHHPPALLAGSMTLREAADFQGMASFGHSRDRIEDARALADKTIVEMPWNDRDDPGLSPASRFSPVEQTAGLLPLWSMLEAPDDDTLARYLKSVIAVQPKAVPAPAGRDNGLMAQEIRYEMSQAGEVFMIWGIRGWKVVPDSMRPPGTVVQNGVMKTPMVREADAFVVRLTVAAGEVIDYGFLITKSRDGEDINVWDDNGVARGYQTIARPERPAVVWGTINLKKAHAFASLPRSPLAVQEIRYQTTEAGEVYLIWGVNGWHLVPEANRPAGTVLKDGLMRTPMARNDDLFTVKISVPSGATIDYGFLMTRDRNGGPMHVWKGDGANDFHTVVTQHGSTTIEADPKRKRSRG